MVSLVFICSLGIHVLKKLKKVHRTGFLCYCCSLIIQKTLDGWNMSVPVNLMMDAENVCKKYEILICDYCLVFPVFSFHYFVLSLIRQQFISNLRKDNT